jgi:hypothetical protein
VCINDILSLFQKWQSVKLLFLKTEKSVSLPIFSSFVTSQDENAVSLRSLRKQVSIKVIILGGA